MLFKLALRNLLAGKTRTILTLLVFTLTLLVTLFLRSLYDGMEAQMTTLRLQEEIAGGQYWTQGFDPFDPFSLEEAQATTPAPWHPLLQQGKLYELLIQNGTAYPKGRLKNVQVRGVNPQQTAITLNFTPLQAKLPPGVTPTMLGARAAQAWGLKVGDHFTLRLRSQTGSFTALELVLTRRFHSSVPQMDLNQVWLPLKDLRQAVGRPGQATLLMLKKGAVAPPALAPWVWMSPDQLLEDTRQLAESKRGGGLVLYSLLFFLSLLALFDSQALAIFRRKQEIGTLMALGLTQQRVTWLFTLEGCLYGLFACGFSLLIGLPLFAYVAATGLDLGISGETYGIPLQQVLYPLFTVRMVLETYASVLPLVFLVSYWPAAQISRLKPAEALREGMR